MMMKRHSLRRRRSYRQPLAEGEFLLEFRVDVVRHEFGHFTVTSSSKTTIRRDPLQNPTDVVGSEAIQIITADESLIGPFGHLRRIRSASELRTRALE